MHRFSRPQIIIISVTSVVVLFFGLLFFGLIPGLTVTKTARQTPVSLMVWGVDPPSAYAEFISAYREQYENVAISYRQFDERAYERALLDALAAGTGPDIFAVHNTWIPKHFNKIAPLTETQFAFSDFQNTYPMVVRQDFAPDRVIYALPLYIDTIATLYNRDILDRNAIIAPPTTWTELQKNIPLLLKKKADGGIASAAAAIGGSVATIPNAADLLSLIMLQYGTPIVDDARTGAAFNEPNGVRALTFYTQFANPDSAVYSWDDEQKTSVDSIASGAVAIIFDYHEAEKLIRAKNPFIQLEVAPVPQISPNESVAYARYYGLTVSNQSKSADWAWHLISALTTNQQNARTYAVETNRLPALRTLIGEYINTAGFEVFAKQALIARSWHQADNAEISRLFSEMISRVTSGQQSVDESIKQASAQMTLLMKGAN